MLLDKIMRQFMCHAHKPITHSLDPQRIRPSIKKQRQMKLLKKIIVEKQGSTGVEGNGLAFCRSKKDVQRLGSQRAFAKLLGWTVAKLNELINGKRGVTADSALDLSATLRTSPELWMNLQMHFDLRRAELRRKKAS